MSLKLFDADYYRSLYQDVAGLDDDQAEQHFMEFGVDEGRECSPDVDLDVYRKSNPDLAAAGLTTNRQLLEHLQNNGVKEGRTFSSVFKASSYMANYADLQAAGLDNEQLLEHFRTWGEKEGRRGSESSSVSSSTVSNTSVRQTGLNNEQVLQNFVSSVRGQDRLAAPQSSVGGSTSATSAPVATDSLATTIAPGEPYPVPPSTPPSTPGPLPVPPKSDSSLTFSPVPKDTGDTLNGDFYGTGLQNFSVTYDEIVGSSDPNDYYRFTVGSNGSNFNVSVLGGSVGVEVYRDANNDNAIAPDEMFIAGANGLSGPGDYGGPTTSFSGGLVEGTYYVRVYGGSSDTKYQLNLSAYPNYSGPPIAI